MRVALKEAITLRTLYLFFLRGGMFFHQNVKVRLNHPLGGLWFLNTFTYFSRNSLKFASGPFLFPFTPFVL